MLIEEGITIKLSKMGAKWTAEIGPPHFLITTGDSASEALMEMAYTLKNMEEGS